MIKKFDNFLSDNVCNYRNNKILKRLHNLFNINLLLTPIHMQIVKWPQNSFMKEHYDSGDQYGVLLYLNDNFEGGETIIGGQIIKPKKGRGVLFTNGKLLHSVCKIKKGTRYVLPIWYK